MPSELAVPLWKRRATFDLNSTKMKKFQFLMGAGFAFVVLCGCGNGHDTVQEGSPQWRALHDTTGADMRAGKNVVIHVPASIYKPGAGGAPPSNVTIVPDAGK
jgi:hypothetical protein